MRQSYWGLALTKLLPAVPVVQNIWTVQDDEKQALCKRHEAMVREKNRRVHRTLKRPQGHHYDSPDLPSVQQ